MDWDKYIKEQLELRKAQMQEAQDLMRQADVRMDLVNQVEPSMMDPQLIQEIEARFGLKRTYLEGEKPPPSATTYRQKRGIMSV